MDGRVTDESEFDWVTVDVLCTSESFKVMLVDALITPEAVIGMEVPPVVVPLLPVSVPIEVGIRNPPLETIFIVGNVRNTKTAIVSDLEGRFICKRFKGSWKFVSKVGLINSLQFLCNSRPG